MVRRNDAKSLESEAGFQRILGRIGFSDFGGLRRIRYRIGDTRLHLVALDALRDDRLAPDVWPGAAHWRHGPLLDHGQARSSMSCRGRLRPCAERNLRPGRPRPHRARRGFQLGRKPRLAQTAHWLLEDGFRTATGYTARAAKRGKGTNCGRKKETRRGNGQSALARARREYDHKYDEAALAKLRAMGINLIPVEFPKFPYQAMRSILVAEAAAAFDDLTRSGRDKLLTQQTKDDWPNTFRSARFIPAVEYIQANRARTIAMDAVNKVFEQVDVIVAPTFSTQLLITILTGHPALILPNGLRGDDAPKPRVRENGEVDPGGPGTPLSLTFLGQLYGEARMLAVAKAYQDATDFHLQHPKLETQSNG